MKFSFEIIRKRQARIAFSKMLGLLFVLVLPISASATKTSPPIPVTLTTDKAVVAPGTQVHFTARCGNNTTQKGYRINKKIIFPPKVRCTAIVSQKAPYYGKGCSLSVNAQGQSVLNCDYDYIYPNGSTETKVLCTLDPGRVCQSDVDTTVILTAGEGAGQHITQSTATFKVGCALPATPTPSATATFTPTRTPIAPTATPTAVVTATPTATPTSPGQVASQINPIVSCVAANKDNSCTAYFGYQNNSSLTIGVGVGGSSSSGSQNTLFPGDADRGQPSIFTPGEYQGVFSADFSCDSVLNWSVKTFNAGVRTATAKFNVSKVCGSVTPVAVCREQLPGGVTKATFGYTNPNSFSVNVAVGDSNFISSGAKDRGQPSKFFAGSVLNAFSIEYSASSITWTVRGASATADASLPLCKSNNPPSCNAGSAEYVASCQGTETTIALSSVGSKDPEGGPVDLQWSTDCESAAFNNHKSGNPSLTLKALSNGGARKCGVTLRVDDGVSVTSCKQTVQVSSCAVLCTQASGAAGQRDICGICGGDGTSCLDCAGVPNGKAVKDSCGVCGGTNACFDCAGVPNGGAKLDRCGVCKGDGQSCLECAAADVTQSLFQMDGDAKAIRSAIGQGIKRGLALDSSAANQARAVKAKAEAARLEGEAWKATWAVPQSLKSCTNTKLCSQSDHSSALQTYSDAVTGLRGIFNQTMRSVKRARGGKVSSSDRALIQKTDALFNSAIGVSGTIPRFSSTCN